MILFHRNEIFSLHCEFSEWTNDETIEIKEIPKYFNGIEMQLCVTAMNEFHGIVFQRFLETELAANVGAFLWSQFQTTVNSIHIHRLRGVRNCVRYQFIGKYYL